MKKSFTKFLITALLTVVASASVNASENVVIRDSVTNEEALQIQELTGLYGEVSFDATKTGTAFVATAAYDADGKLLSVKTASKEMTAGTVFETKTEAVDSSLAEIVKVFVWDKADMSPIIKKPRVIVKNAVDEEKFIKKEVTEVKLWETITLGDLFAESSEELKNPIKSSDVQVTVSDAEYVYEKNDSDWKNSTLLMNSLGTATVTITDNRLCKTAEIQFAVVEPDPVERYEVIFKNTDKYIYRIGNKNAVSVASLFKATEGAEITSDSVEITVESVDGEANGKYTKNASDWTKGTIQFSGTGLVNVTVKDSLYSVPKTVQLEVIDAKNLTTKLESASSSDIVLLNDVSGETTISNGRTLHGNGFTITLPTKHETSIKNGFWGYIVLQSGNIDNVKIIGPVYPVQYMFRSQAINPDNDQQTLYFLNSIKVESGECSITNSYISGSRTGICIESNTYIGNTTVSGGSFANIEIVNSVPVTFEDVTTIQTPVENSYGVLDDDGNVKKMMGLGIVVTKNEGGIELHLKGELNQYNWASQKEVTTYVPSELLSTFNTFYTNSSFTKFRAARNGEEYINYGIVYAATLDQSKIYDERDDDKVYEVQKLTILGASGGVYSTTGVGVLTDDIYIAPEYDDEEQYRIAPVYKFDFTNKNYQGKVEGSNDYCVYSEGAVQISFDEGDTFSWDTSILTATKYGNVLPYTVNVDGTDYSGKSITFNATGNHIVTYKYTDPYNYRINSVGEIEAYSVEYEKTVTIDVAAVKPTAKHAEFTFGSNNTPATTVVVGNDIYVMPNDTSLKSTTVNGQKIYYPTVEMFTSDGKWEHSSLNSWCACFPVFDGAVTITDYENNGTGAEVIYNSSTKELPKGLSVPDGPKTVFKYQASNDAPSTPTVKDNVLCYTSPTLSNNARTEMNILVKYHYTDNAGGSYYYYINYHCKETTVSNSNPCVTPETLITLADGTQKRIDELTYSDELLVWNFVEGKYDISKPAIIFDHGYSMNKLVKLNFADGTFVNMLNLHQFFDATLNKFVTLTDENVSEFVGHKFAKANGDTYENVELVNYEIKDEYNKAMGVISAKYCNIITNGMISTDVLPEDYLLFNFFEMGEDMKYDAEKMQEDIEKYGLYTYEEFADYLTIDEFYALNCNYLKIAVGKGYYTFEELLEKIEYWGLGFSENENPDVVQPSV